MVYILFLFLFLEIDKSRFLGIGDFWIIVLLVLEILRCFVIFCEVDSVEVVVSFRKYWILNFFLSIYKI